MNIRPIFSLFIFIAGLAIFSSCRHEYESPRWETGVLAPLMKSTLTMDDLLADSLSKYNDDSTISVVYEDTLYQFSMDSMFQLPDTTVTRVVKLDSISLSDKSIIYPVSLGYLAKELIAQGGMNAIYGNLIISSNGSSMTIPAINGIASGDIDINAQDFFQTVTLVSGFMDVCIKNGFPTDIQNVIFQLKNKSNQNIVLQDTFPYIAAGAKVCQSIPLDGKTIEGNLVAKLINIDVTGTASPVVIDTSDQLVTTISVRDLRPYTATALFPAQDLVNFTEKLPFSLSDVELNKATIRSGYVRIEAYSTLQDTLYFRYKIPSATLGTDTFYVFNKIPPAPTGGVSSFFKLYDFAGYNLDLTGMNKDTVNTIYHQLRGSIDSTGIIRTISLSDSFWVNTGLIDIVPSYAKGYLGSKTFNVGPDTTALNLFNHITDGTLDLEDLKLSMSVTNGIGADARITITDLSSINSKKSTTVPLTAASLINVPRTINRATDNPFVPALDTIKLDGSNSNAPALIENLPDKMSYLLTLETNPNGNISGFPPGKGGVDFIYDDKPLTALLNLEMPLSMSASQLTLTDTSDFKVGEVSAADKIRSGILTLIVDNGFPFDATVQLFPIDDYGNITDSLFAVNKAAAAITDPVTYKVTSKTKSKLTIPVDHDKIDRILSTKRIIIRARFSTMPAGKFIKIYSHYTIDLKLVADFNYLID